MAQLGLPTRILYISKNLRTGLTDVVARVVKPNGSIIGEFPLVEFVGAFFAGIYYFDLMSSDTDPLGDWAVVIYSPSENGYRTASKVTYEMPQVSIAEAVWTQTAGSGETYGSYLQNKVLNVSKFLGLK